MDHLLLMFICSLLCTGVSGMYGSIFNPAMLAKRTQAVKEKGSLTIECVFSSDVPCENITLVWLINDRSVFPTVANESCDATFRDYPESRGMSYVSEPDENGIRNYHYSWTALALTRADHGQRWQCVAQVSKGLFQVQIHRSDVTIISVEGISGADRILMHPRPTTTVTENDILTLTCVYTTNLTSTEFTLEWRKDGASFAATAGCQNTTEYPILGYTIGDSCHKFGNETYTYKLTTVATRTDHGQRWECAARTTPNDQSQHSGATTVSVNVPITNVTITSPSENTVSIEEGTEKEFVCETSPSRPAAFRIGWFLYTGPKINSMIRWLPLSFNSNWKRPQGDTTHTGSDGLTVTTGKLRLRPSLADNGWKLFCGASNIKDEFTNSWVSSEIQTSDEKVLDVYQRLN